MTIHAVRGAVTLSEDSPRAMEESLEELWSALMKENHLHYSDIINVFFTLTTDIHAANPARVTRKMMGWDMVAMLCSTEPEIRGFPGLCVRVLVQFETDRPVDRLHHVYLRGAASLRPDL